MPPCRSRTPHPQSAEKDRAGSFVLSVAYSPDGRRLACGTMDGTVAVFDTATAQLLHTLPVRGRARLRCVDCVSSLRVGPDAAREPVQGLHMPVRSLAWLPDSATLVVACDDGFVSMCVLFCAHPLKLQPSL